MGIQTKTYTVTAGRKIIYIDVETTGVNKNKNAIWQLAAIVEIDGQVKERFIRTMKPDPSAEIEDEALAIGGITRADLEGFQDQKMVHVEFRQFLGKYVDQYNPGDKFTICGYNVKFDVGFLRSWFLVNNNRYYGSYFYSSDIDVYSLAADRCLHFRNRMANMKLETVARIFGIPIPDNMHDAGNDIEVTRRLYYCLQEKDLYASTFMGTFESSDGHEVPATGIKDLVKFAVAELMNNNDSLVLEGKLVELCYGMARKSQATIVEDFKQILASVNLPGVGDVKADTDADEFIERGKIKPWYLIDDYD